MTENEIGTIALDCAITVHKELGPGLLESVYETVLTRELLAHDLNVQRQVLVPVFYKGHRLEEGFRADIIVDDKVILEIKSVDKIAAVHHKQLLTYLRLTGYKLGYLLNFGDLLMKDGITRTVNDLPELLE